MAGDGIDQLQQIAMATQPRSRGRGRGQGQRGRGHNHEIGQGNLQEPFPRQVERSNQSHHHYPPSQAWSAPAQLPSADINAFPPLGFAQQQHQQRRRHQQSYQTPQQFQQQYQPQETHSHHGPAQQIQRGPAQHQREPYIQQDSGYVQHQAQVPVRGSFDSSRGRGFRGGYQQQRRTGPHQMQYHNNQPLANNNNDFTRPAAHPNQRLYTTDANSHFGNSDQQRAFRHKIMTQSDFLASLASQNLRNQMTQEELQAKEIFRRQLQDIAQQAVASVCSEPTDVRAEEVKLRLYGSLGSGFAVAGSDMDLLLAFPPRESSSADAEIGSRRVLEKALLDAGYGARLLTNTRVPILKVCEKPSPELLSNLRAYRSEWEITEAQANDSVPSDQGNELLPDLSSVQTGAATEALVMLDLEPADIPLPASPILEQAKLEFSGECGIQCDINFSNYVALHNTELLKAYGRADSRVRQMGIFVKNWAKTRDINTPYRGTLSSYGYILMVLHYLMNIVKPPVIPNLQEAKKTQDDLRNNQDILLVEGFDVRFVRDPEEVQDLLQKMPKNHESLGSLLRGFFWYYSVPQGFHWSQDVISIRTDGGRVTKRSKGWTEAKWANQSSNVRLRYLLAIEDPFETEHNVGRTVGHSGIVAIRDEFRRAWLIIDAVQYDILAKTYYWVKAGTDERQNAEEFMATLTDRGDLLRKDQNFHREKMRRMRQEAEAKEQALKEEVLENPVSSATADDTQTNGTWTDENSEHPSSVDPSHQRDWPNQELIQHRSYQEKNWERKQMKNHPSRRQVQDEPDDASDVDDAGRGNTAEATSDQEPNCHDNCQEEHCEQAFADSKGNVRALQEGTDKEKPLSQNTSVSQREMPPPNFARDTTVQTYLDPHNHSSFTDKKVGRRSLWDRQTEAGRWLHWRDNVVRSGETFSPVDPIYKNLNDKFPYDPEMSYADVAVLNSELRRHYLETLWPTNASVSSESAVESSDNLVPGSIGEQNHTLPIRELDVNLPTGTPCSSNIQSQPSDLARDTSNTSIPSNAPSDIDIRELRKRRTEYFDRSIAKRVPESASKTRRDSAVSFVQAQTSSTSYHGTNDIPQEIGPKSKSPVVQHDQTLLNHRQKLLSLLNISASPAVEQVVPLTLYPDMPNDQRPRDEDPMIMPIPQRVGFKFDPRQLADLEIIRQGGNGCAKKGEEFSIEEDYDFGGGGEMAYKSSSGLRCTSESGLQLSWRPGQSDLRESMLDEGSGLR